MATLALSVVGQFAGAMVGGPIGATIGRALGALAGNAIDGMLFGDRRTETGFDLRLSGSAEGGPIPRLYGWGRLSGNIIWARELERLAGETTGAKGTGGSQDQDEIGASFAIAFCEGPVARLGRIWADGQVLDTRGLNLRFYHGDDDQLPDSLIEATQDAGQAPAYRGLCYLVVENLPLSRFGNRIPQISAELCRVVGELEQAIRAVTVIPGATEFGYDPVPRVQMISAGKGRPENSHIVAGTSNWTWSIDELVALCPNLEHVALVVRWFGNDLRCGHCTIAPRVEASNRTVKDTSWSVAGVTRSGAQVVSSHAGGAAYGGTPSDASVLAAIADLKARGLKVTLYPLMMMDVPAGNSLPDPHGPGSQPAYPWRGRVTCYPAPGRPGSPDGSAAAAAQVAAFVPGYRAMVLHYAGLAVAAGGVDALLIGSEMVALTGVRGAADSFPFVSALVTLAADVRAVVGAATKLTYAADWTEYSGCQRDGDRFFHLDPLWASPHIDAVGIDCYMPLSDWRDGRDHADAAISTDSYELDYLEGNVAGGEGFDWYYASDVDRRAQVRTPITDGAYGEPWVWRHKDIHAFWSQQHYNRPGGVRAATPTAWVPGSKPIWLTEVGCGAVDRAANQPNIFGDAKSVEGGRPYFSSGLPDALIQRQFLRAHHRYWADPVHNPAGMLDPARIYCWTWDARPYPAFPAMEDVWADGPNHRTGHWLTGRLGALASDELLCAIAQDHGLEIQSSAASPLIGGMVRAGPETARQAIEPVLELTAQMLRADAGVLRAQKRGAGAQIALDKARLADNGGAVVVHRRAAVAERPGRLALAHMDRERDYLTATATAPRRGEGPLVAETMPVVLDSGGARQAAERLLNERAALGDSISLSLPPNSLAIEPGDRLQVEGQGERPFVVSEIRDGLVRRIVARSEPQGEASATGIDRPRAGPGAPAAEVPPVVVTAHLPPAPGQPERSRLLIGAYARPWPGSVRFYDAATGTLRAELTRPAVLGEVTGGIGPGPRALWDRVNALDVILWSGHLADVAPGAALAGSNRVAVQTDAGAWEVIGFAGAELLAPRRYRLTGLLRGLEGTDAAMGAVSAGRRVVVLDGRLGVIPVEPGQLGTSHDLQVHGGSDLVGAAHTVALMAGPALPLAPVHLRATRLDGGSIRFDWVRRSQADGVEWGVAEPALDHVPEAWRLTVIAGGTALRVLEPGTTSAIYSPAQQAADFGGPAPAFTYTIAQLSPLLGPGHLATGEFHG